MNKKEQKVVVAQIKQYLREGSSLEVIKQGFLEQGRMKDWQKIQKKLQPSFMTPIKRKILVFGIILCALLVQIVLFIKEHPNWSNI